MSNLKITPINAAILVLALYGLTISIWGLISTIPALLRVSGSLSVALALIVLLFRDRINKKN